MTGDERRLIGKLWLINYKTLNGVRILCPRSKRLYVTNSFYKKLTNYVIRFTNNLVIINVILRK